MTLRLNRPDDSIGPMTRLLNVSLGIMAYNEEANIGQLLQAVLNQRFLTASLKEIFVVASGCTDRTEHIVQGFSKKDQRIKLLVQGQREGKASAINLFFSQASADIYILESADTVPEEGTLEKLIAPFADKKVGMTGAHPVPINTSDTFTGFAVNMMWSLHHKIALITPKLGELVAFRSFVRKIPHDTAVDEASIEAIVKRADYELRYVPEAIVRNKGPENVKDFLKQRRRIAAGHMHLARTQGHRVSTLSAWRILGHLRDEMNWKPKELLWTVGAVALEAIGRLLGHYDFCFRKINPYIWDMATSTKKLSQ
jgi:biofilm PGA synthesis N-glycosyltransferase PgaC